MAANNENDDEKIGAALQKEFVSGMQAIVASGTAVDAYYALAWYSSSGHLEKRDKMNQLLEVTHDKREKDLYP